jgi:hypothetical protein
VANKDYVANMDYIIGRDFIVNTDSASYKGLLVVDNYKEEDEQVTGGSAFESSIPSNKTRHLNSYWVLVYFPFIN